MKVILCYAALLCAAASAAPSPMFGLAGMMRRRFPGAPDMSYNTYMSIAETNRRGETAPQGPIPRSGTSGFPNFSFENEIPDSTRGSVRRPSQELSDEHFLQYRYPTSFDPRQSYAMLNFPYQAPMDVQYRRTHKPAHYGNYYY